MAYKGPLQDSVIFDTAKDVGLDVGRLRKDLTAPEITDEIIRELQSRRSLRIFQTPGFIVGNHILTGPSADIDFPKAWPRRAPSRMGRTVIGGAFADHGIQSSTTHVRSGIAFVLQPGDILDKIYSRRFFLSWDLLRRLRQIRILTSAPNRDPGAHDRNATGRNRQTAFPPNR